MTQKFYRKAFALVILCFLYTSCHTRKVEYSLKKIPAAIDQKLSGLVFDIEIFNDSRRAIEKNNILFKPVLKQTPDEMKWYWNVDKKYKNNVPEALTGMLAAHWGKRGSFKSVKINRRDSADYYLTGTLNLFYGAQLPGNAEGAVVLGCILPILAIPAFIYALTEETKTVVVIELKDLSLYNRKNELIFQTDVSRRYERKYRSWGGPKAVYRSINYVLKDYYSALITMLEYEIKKAEG